MISLELKEYFDNISAEEFNKIWDDTPDEGITIEEYLSLYDMYHKVIFSCSTGISCCHTKTTDEAIIKKALENDGFKNVEILEIKLNDKA